MNFRLILPEPIFAIQQYATERDSFTSRFPYRWRATYFPSLIIESSIPNPMGKCFDVQVKIEDGKNRERTQRYTSKLKLRLGEKVDVPTHELIWVRDSGKFAYCNEPSDLVVVFPGQGDDGNIGGWLIMVIRSLNVPAT